MSSNTLLIGNALIVEDAGHGTTPPCPEAKFKPRDVVRIRRLAHLRCFPAEAAVFAVVPPGFPGEYALADAAGKPRPLMITAPYRCISYIVGFEGDPKPLHIRESALLPSDQPPAEIGWTDAASGSAA